MNTTENTLPPEIIEEAQLLADFEPAQVTYAIIAQLKEKYSGLTIANIHDKDGYAKVHNARIEIRDKRTGIEKVRVNLNKDHNEYIKKVNAEAKKLTAMVVEIEVPLNAEESRIDREIQDEKNRKQKEADELLQSRITALNAVRGTVVINEIVMMTETIFAAYLRSETEKFEASEKVRIAGEEAIKAQAEKEALEKLEADRIEKEKQAAIAEVNAKESARLEVIRIDQEKLAKELKEAQDKINRENDRIIQRAREEQILKDSAEQERINAEYKKASMEAAKPDAEKINAIGLLFSEYDLPELISKDGKQAIIDIKKEIILLSQFCYTKANSLTK